MARGLAPRGPEERVSSCTSSGSSRVGEEEVGGKYDVAGEGRAAASGAGRMAMKFLSWIRRQRRGPVRSRTKRGVLLLADRQPWTLKRWFGLGLFRSRNSRLMSRDANGASTQKHMIDTGAPRDVHVLLSHQTAPDCNRHLRISRHRVPSQRDHTV